MTTAFSFVQYIGYIEKGPCGYCKGKNKASLGERRSGAEEEAAHELSDDGSSSLGTRPYSLTVEHFNSLIETGWHRSGCYLYKPLNDRTCCPQYTIRLDVHNFVLSRTQKRVIRNMENYLRFGTEPKGVKEEDNRGKGPPQKAEEKVEKEDISDKGERVPGERGQKKKDLRKMRAIQRWTMKGLDVAGKQQERRDKADCKKKSLEDRLRFDEKEGDQHRLRVEIVQDGTPEFAARAEESFALFAKYQKKIHKDDSVSRGGYERFLIKTPLKTHERYLGSFHHRYIMDERLVAVGVVDVMPGCLSSKYLFYDPDLSALNLGTYTALREIEMVKRLAKVHSTIHYYYMGYYIATCPKMRYKGRFKPSQLLCDSSFQWVNLEHCHKMLESNANAFTVFCPTVPRAPRMQPDTVRVLHRTHIVLVAQLTKSEQDLVKEDLQDFCALIEKDQNWTQITSISTLTSR